MWKALAAILTVAALAAPSSAGAAAAWVPGFDELAPAAANSSVRVPVAVVTPDRRTAAFWVDYPRIRAAVRPRGGTFGEPFVFDAGNSNYVADSLGAVALPSGEVVVAWSGPSTQELKIRSLHPDGTKTEARPPEAGGGYPAIAANAAGMVAVAYYSFNQLYLLIRAAGADTFQPAVLLLSLTANEQAGPLDVAVRSDGQVSIAVGTSVVNPPGGVARMLVVRRSGATTSVETVDSRTLNLTQPPGTSSSAVYSGAIEQLADGRQLLVYRLQTVTSGSYFRELRGGPRDGTPAAAPPLLDDQVFGVAFGPKEHGLVLDDGGRPWVWWRKGTASGEEELRVRQGTTAGAFSAPSQVLASPAFGAVDLETFGAGRMGLLFTQSGKVRASTSEAGTPFGAPLDVATPSALSPAPLAPVALAGAGEGSAVGLWADGATLQTSALHATPFDATPPTLPSIQAPASLTAGAAGTFSATAQDDWSVPSVSWLFGDGAMLAGASVQHAFASAGSFAATATATDAAGNTATGARTVTVTAAPSPPPAPPPPPPLPPPSVDTRAPLLSSVRLSPRTLRGGRRSATLSFSLDEVATVVAQLERALPGYRSGGRCVAKRPASGTPRRCTRFVRSGKALRRASRAGAGRLAIERPPTKGRYRVAVHAADAAGNRSTTQRRTLTVR